MSNKITIPEQFLHTMLMIVAVRTKQILGLSCLNDDQKQTSINDMVDRVMKDVRDYGEMG